MLRPVDEMSTPSLIFHPSPFKGFPGGKVRLTRIPAQFFSELLPQIDHLGELKVTLYTLWCLDQMEGSFRYLRYHDYAGDERLMQGLGSEPTQALAEALQRAAARGTLLMAEIPGENGSEAYYFLNTPRGRAAIAAIQQGNWRPTGDPQEPIALDLERPNIFRLYEENIGRIDSHDRRRIERGRADLPRRMDRRCHPHCRRKQRAALALHPGHPANPGRKKDAMSKIEETLKKIADATSKVPFDRVRQALITRSDMPGDPDCPICGGLGFVRQRPAHQHPDFGKVEICQCRQGQVTQSSASASSA